VAPAHRPSGRITLIITIAAVLLAVSRTASAQRLAAYVSLVDQYSRGEAQDAVVQLARRGNERITKDIAAWMRQLSPDQLRAAVMMHTDLGYVLMAGGQGSSALLQIRNAESLIGIMIGNGHDMEAPRAFAIRWYAFTAGMFTSQGQLDAASGFVRAGLAAYPRAAELYVARGSIMEMRASMDSSDDLRRGISVSRAGRPALRIARMQESAAADFERAIECDGHFAPAHLHRGWVHYLVHDDRASSDLEAALAATATDDVRYLAHLFLGAVAEGRGDLEAARTEFEAARTIAPHQSSSVALSRVEAALGHTERARTIAAEAAGHAAQTDDPWWNYHLGGFDADILFWLRREARHQ